MNAHEAFEDSAEEEEEGGTDDSDSQQDSSGESDGGHHTDDEELEAGLRIRIHFDPNPGPAFYAEYRTGSKVLK